MREERNALQAERLEQERKRLKEALVFENLRKNMERREEELARQLREARDRDESFQSTSSPSSSRVLRERSLQRRNLRERLDPLRREFSHRLHFRSLRRRSQSLRITLLRS
jgi:hypothetical protein